MTFARLLTFLRHLPSWCVLFVLFVLLMVGYYIRPDNMTEDAAKAVLGALLLSIQRSATTPVDPQQPPIIPNENPPPAVP